MGAIFCLWLRSHRCLNPLLLLQNRSLPLSDLDHSLKQGPAKMETSVGKPGPQLVVKGHSGTGNRIHGVLTPCPMPWPQNHPFPLEWFQHRSREGILFHLTRDKS